MSFAGTVVNGAIVLDDSACLPDGFRVRVEVEDVLDGDDIGAPPEPYDRETHLALIREGLEDVKAGRTQTYACSFRVAGRTSTESCSLSTATPST